MYVHIYIYIYMYTHSYIIYTQGPRMTTSASAKALVCHLAKMLV